jgi:hypothetical protein
MQMRALVARIDCRLVDLRGLRKKRPELYDPDDYRASRAFGVSLRWPRSGEGSNGIAYDSVRRKDGINVCIYKPSLVRLPVTQSDHYEYRWDAHGSVNVLRLGHVEQGR